MTDTKAPAPEPADSKKPSSAETELGDDAKSDPKARPSQTQDLRPEFKPPPKPQRPAAPRAVKHSMADMLVGTVLADRYKLLERLGEGAMGWVFLAEHTEIGKKYAVKVLRPSLCRLPEAVRRFRREARAATQIGSKHIVDVTDFGTTPNGAVFFVMDQLQGGEDLGTTLKVHKRLPWERVLDMTKQCCEALQAAHDAEIIHRDVKPANFYRMEQDGNPDFIKILDFGIARLSTPKDSIVTATGVVMGTPDFMAPEQARGGKVDHRADIYSLGATAYALVTGRPPFVGANEYDVIYKQLNEDPQPLRERVPGKDIPGWFDEAILKAMRKDPEERYRSMSEFAAALRPPDPKRQASSAETSTPQMSARSGSRSMPISPAILVFAAVGLGLIGFLMFYAFVR